MHRWLPLLGVMSIACLIVGDGRAAVAGVTFKQTEGVAPGKAMAGETRLPPALTLSNQLGERAAAAAVSGDLESASHLAELSAQAMTGQLTRNDLAKVKITGVENLPSLPLSPALVQVQQTLGRQLQSRIAATAANPAARAATATTFQQFGTAYRDLRVRPAEARQVLASLATQDAALDAGRQTQPAGDRPAESTAAGNDVTMMLVPAGRYLAGSPATERARKSTEAQRDITIGSPFLLSMTEITQGQFKGLMGTEPWAGRPFVRVGEHYPATWVSWDDAVAYCERLTERHRAAGRLSAQDRFRLPTEVEWEYACRADSAAAYSFGSDPSKLGDHAWFKGNAAENGKAFAHRVGTRKPNAWGIHDMHGNALEWCSDWYADTPDGATDLHGPDHGTERVCRGGSWGNDAADCRSASRFAVRPDTRNDFTGFRVARDVASP